LRSDLEGVCGKVLKGIGIAPPRSFTEVSA
jgi:hypothetical protein